MNTTEPTKQQKEVIDNAIAFCEKYYLKFFQRINEVFPQGEAMDLVNFLRANTYVAGGVFRSLFTNTPVNDIDIFFTSLDAAVEFQHRMLKNDRGLFPEKNISPNRTYMYNFYRKSDPCLSFITQYAGPPEYELTRFDFSFNQHYYYMHEGKFRFDLNTFDFEGTLTSQGPDPIVTLVRGIRFLKEGFNIPIMDLLNLLHRVVEYSSKGLLLDSLHTVLERTSSSEQSPHGQAHIRNRWYTDASSAFQRPQRQQATLGQLRQTRVNSGVELNDLMQDLYNTSNSSTIFSLDLTT